MQITSLGGDGNQYEVLSTFMAYLSLCECGILNHKLEDCIFEDVFFFIRIK
jgi:hypothetical protein